MKYYAVLNPNNYIEWIFKSSKPIEELMPAFNGKQYYEFDGPDFDSTETPLEHDSWEELPDGSINIYKDYMDVFPLRIGEGENDVLTEEQYTLNMVRSFYTDKIQEV